MSNSDDEYGLAGESSQISCLQMIIRIHLFVFSLSRPDFDADIEASLLDVSLSSSDEEDE